MATEASCELIVPRRSISHSTAPPAPPIATPTLTLSRNPPGSKPPELDSPANTSAATIAPTGSIRIPSQRSTRPTAGLGRTNSSSGSTTVGPETMRMAPTSSAIPTGRSKSTTAPPKPTAQVISAPSVSRRTTTGGVSASSSSRRRPSAPSNRITPTASETNGESRSPSSSLGSTRSATEGPARIPAMSRGTIAGMRSRAASTMQPTASTTTTVRPTSGSCKGQTSSRSCFAMAATTSRRGPRVPADLGVELGQGGAAPIMANEFGCGSAATTDAARAQQIAQLTSDLARSDCGVTGIAPYTWLGNQAAGGAEAGLGLVDASGTHSRAAQAYLSTIRDQEAGKLQPGTVKSCFG